MLNFLNHIAQHTIGIAFCVTFVENQLPMKYLFTIVFIFIFIADSLTQKVLKARSLSPGELIRSEVPLPENDERLPYEKLFENERISISTAYPNPASGFTNFDYQLSDKAKDARITLSDVFGTVI